MENVIQPNQATVVGIDVGGKRKGLHAVALRGGQYFGRYSSGNAQSVVDWCDEMQASAVGMDAPCCWSKTGRARAAERELMGERIWCFSTPTRVVAESHPTDYFRWMLSGAELYGLLTVQYPLLDEQRLIERPVCFETFPHAITCALLGRVTSAKRKGTERRDILRAAGVDTVELTNIDWVDAALCALTAHQFLAGNFKTYGDEKEGFVVVPGKTLS